MIYSIDIVYKKARSFTVFLSNLDGATDGEHQQQVHAPFVYQMAKLNQPCFCQEEIFQIFAPQLCD